MTSPPFLFRKSKTSCCSPCLSRSSQWWWFCKPKGFCICLYKSCVLFLIRLSIQSNQKYFILWRYLVVGNHYNERIIGNHLVSDTESQGHMSSQFCAWTQQALTSFHHIQAGHFQPCLMSIIAGPACWKCLYERHKKGRWQWSLHRHRKDLLFQLGDLLFWWQLLHGFQIILISRAALSIVCLIVSLWKLIFHNPILSINCLLSLKLVCLCSKYLMFRGALPSGPNPITVYTISASHKVNNARKIYDH